MPVYEYSCEQCGEKFDVIATLAEKEAGLQPVCPSCGGMNVRQVFGRFTVVGGSKVEDSETLPDLGGDDYHDEELGDLGDEGFTGDEDLDSLDEDLNV
ncbi:MAG: FmdB family zinc ribbon protein [bacterium]